MNLKPNSFCLKALTRKAGVVFFFALCSFINPAVLAQQGKTVIAQSGASSVAPSSAPNSAPPRKKCRVTLPISPTVFKPLFMEGTLREGETDCYEIRLEAGQYLHAVVDQQGVDVVVSLFGPSDSGAGELLTRVDRPNLRFGPEPVSWIARTPGVFTLQVYPLMKSGAAGRYGLIELEVRAAQPQDQQRVTAQQLMTEAEQLRARGDKLRSPKEREWLAEGLEKFQRAREVWQAIRSADATDENNDENNYELALASFGVGLCHRARGEFALAATEFKASLANLENVKYPAARYTEAAVTTNLARSVLNIGEAEKARSLFASTLDTRVAFNDSPGLGASLSGLADAQAALGRYSEAERTFADALKYRGTDTRGIALTLMSIGRLQEQNHRYDEAIKTLEEARKLLREIGENEGYALANIGRAYAQQCDYPKAIENLSKAIELVKGSDPASEAMTRYQLARIKREVGDLQSACDNIHRSLKLVESLNQRGADPILRARYVSSTRELYEFAISVNMQMHRAAPDQNYAADALQVSERMHARQLIDLLSEAREHYPANGVPNLARVDMSHGGDNAYDKAYVIDKSEPLGLRQIQQQLDPDTLLLEYAIGPGEAFMWAVTRTSFHSFSLPAVQVNQTAQDAVEMLTKDAALVSKFEAQMGVLGRLLLPAPTPSLVTQYKKLLVVSDGILHTLPFAGLTLPGQSYEPLMARHEIINLPSLSALALARQQATGRSRAPNSVVVLTDPIFTRSDERVATGSRCEGGEADVAAARILRQHAAGGTSAGVFLKASAVPKEILAPDEALDLTRLDRIGGEAAIIKNLWPSAVIHSGKDASLETVKSGKLSQYQVIHFATHTATRGSDSSEMGVILSQFDQCGQHRDGFLGIPEILHLRFPAELVVLGACEYGVGKDAAGDWIGGLSTAFIRAGARRVVAGVWPSQSRVTTEFMERFYNALFEGNRSPAAALSETQAAMWREGKYAPADYLGFVTYGEWRQ